jgi:predicted nucleic acid-binding protein
MAMLVDTGGLVAFADLRDRFHFVFRRFFEEHAQHETLIVPSTVLPEVDYFVSRNMGAHAAASFMEQITTGELRFEFLSAADFPRTIELMRQYADSDIGFVDASLVAVAERLNIRKVITLDRRHFGPIRPRHCPALEILP